MCQFRLIPVLAHEIKIHSDIIIRQIFWVPLPASCPSICNDNKLDVVIRVAHQVYKFIHQVTEICLRLDQACPIQEKLYRVLRLLPVRLPATLQWPCLYLLPCIPRILPVLALCSTVKLHCLLTKYFEVAFSRFEEQEMI